MLLYWFHRYIYEDCTLVMYGIVDVVGRAVNAFVLCTSNRARQFCCRFVLQRSSMFYPRVISSALSREQFRRFRCTGNGPFTLVGTAFGCQARLVLGILVVIQGVVVAVTGVQIRWRGLHLIKCVLRSLESVEVVSSSLCIVLYRGTMVQNRHIHLIHA